MGGLSGSKLCGCDSDCACLISGDDQVVVTPTSTGYMIRFAGIAFDTESSCGVTFEGLGTDASPLCLSVCQRTMGAF